MRKFFLLVLVSLVLATCSSKQSFNHQFFKAGKSQGIIDNKAIDEASGLATSVVNQNMFWTHNDSGDKARIFLIDKKAKCVATVNFPELKNRDWEDIAVGPGPEAGASYIYIGEIGDNFSRYDYKLIYRLKEPVIQSQKKPIEIAVSHVDSIKFNLPDGKRDTETLMVDPLTNDIYIFSKREKQVRLYVLPYPQSTNEITTAKFLLQIPFTQFNSGDISPDGKEVLLKNYSHVFYWFKTADESFPELFKTEPIYLPYVTEPQGEAIAFDRNGKGYFTLSEETNNKKPHLMFYERKKRNVN